MKGRATDPVTTVRGKADEGMNVEFKVLLCFVSFSNNQKTCPCGTCPPADGHTLSSSLPTAPWEES